MDKPVVFVIDDDESICRALRRLIRSVGLNVRTFTSAEDFLNQGYQDMPGCLVLDVKLPGLDGLELQKKLIESNSKMGIVFISAHEDAQTREQAMKAGAKDFFQKPFDDAALLGAVQSVLKEIQDDELSPESQGNCD
jgi:FixJ family two-component response regulator